VSFDATKDCKTLENFFPSKEKEETKKED